jgi:hypothetical protein
MVEEIKPGTSTSEFWLSSAGMFVSTVIGTLTVFGVLHLSPEQEKAVYQFVAISWTVLPAAYAIARAHVKASAVKAPETIMQNKQVTETEPLAMDRGTEK